MHIRVFLLLSCEFDSIICWFCIIRFSTLLKFVTYMLHKKDNHLTDRLI
jgi:hypothetical protein